MSDPYVRAGRIRRALFDIRHAYDATLAQVRRGTGSHATAAAFPALLISADILDKRAMACSRLAGWAMVVIDERDLHIPLHGTDVPGLTKFLDAHADYLATHPAVKDVITELEASAAELGGIVLDNAPHRFQVGACPGTTNGLPCPGAVKATVRADDDLLPSELACDATPRHVWPAGEWRVLQRRLHMDEGAARRLAAAIK